MSLKLFHLPFRIIPACAGNSRELDHVRGIRPDHPRVCGEQFNATIDGTNYAGSSPRVRGTDHVLLVLDALGRIIPACAGNRRP